MQENRRSAPPSIELSYSEMIKLEKRNRQIAGKEGGRGMDRLVKTRNDYPAVRAAHQRHHAAALPSSQVGIRRQ